jgi:2-polyprenyl-3-methyl-5-hydroxy-6-metoxy-1,4-benzoquinol methylase
VTTCDYSSYGIKQQNPELLGTFEKGSLIDSIEECVDREECFSFINLQNVLEHVINPEALLIRLKEIVSSNGLIRIQVPNDYSSFQKLLLEKGQTKETWFAPPEHLHYFTIESLKKLAKKLGYSICQTMTDFPIELFLLNESSNYTKDRSVGKYAYQSKVQVNNFISSKGCEQAVNFFSSCAEVDLGRNIILYISADEISN